MADISKIQVPGSATQYNIKDAQARRDIEDVKADLGALSDMSSESALGWTWELGSYTSGGAVTANDKRVRSGKHMLDAPLTLYVEDGYRYYVHYYASESATAHDTTRPDGGVSGWITTSYTIDANAWFAISIAKTAESGDYTASTDWGSYVYSVVESVLINTVLSSKALAESNELRLDEIEEALANDTLPDYWTTYLDGKKSSIVNALADIGNHGDVFTYFTDYHAPLNAGHTAEVLGYINSMVDMRKNVFGGDILTNHSKSDALSILNAFASDFKDLNLLSTNGNHEYNRYSGDTADRLTDAEWYAFLLGDNELDRRISFMSPKGYYYVDNSVQKIRYLFLNTNYSFTQFSVNTTQIRWIISTLNSVEKGWGVVIFTHWYYGTVNADYTLTRDGIGDAIKAICDGYATKTTGTVLGVEAQFNVDFDFTNADGEMICVICGHTHNDYAEQSESGWWVIATMCDAYHGSQQNPAITRTLGTVSEQAIDLYFIDRTERKISTIRIGAGSDRTFTY